MPYILERRRRERENEGAAGLGIVALWMAPQGEKGFKCRKYLCMLYLKHWTACKNMGEYRRSQKLWRIYKKPIEYDRK
jgi:hypothetical protein